MEGPPVLCGHHTAPAVQLHKLAGCPIILPPSAAFSHILFNVSFISCILLSISFDSRWYHWGFFSVVPLSSTQPLKVSTRDLFWGKGGRCVRLTTFHSCSVETSRKSGILTYPEPLGPPRPVAGDLYLFLLSISFDSWWCHWGFFSVVPLSSTQPLKVSTRDFFWGKGGRCVRLTTFHSCSAESQGNPGS